MVELQLVVAGLSVVMVAVLARLAWVTSPPQSARFDHRSARARERGAADHGDPGAGLSRAPGSVMASERVPALLGAGT
jgi:hypothetical protein